MALADIIIPRREIPVFDTSFTVRPLCVDDVMRALFDAQDDVKAAAALYEEIVGDKKDDETLLRFLTTIMDRLPTLAARIVAYASDEPDKWEVVRTLPVPVQADAFFAVFELTFSEPDSLKKFVGKLTSSVAMLTKKS